MQGSPNFIYFSPFELWFLCSLYPGNSVLGFNNPCLGLDKADIAQIQQETQQRLVKRDLIRINRKGAVSLNENTARIISGMVNDTHLAAISIQQSGQSQKNFIFHYGPDQIVRHFEIEPGRHQLGSLESSQNAHHIVQTFLIAKQDIPPLSDQSIQVELSAFVLARKSLAARQTEEARHFLELGGMQSGDLNEFIPFLARCITVISVSVLLNRHQPANQVARAFGLFASPDATWQFQVIEQSRVDLSLTSPSEVGNTLDRILPPFPIE